MTNWEYATGAGVVVFFADVENTGETLGSATIQCEITYGNGDTYTGERNITLVPGQSDRVVISVMTSLSHLEDSSGTFDCRISV